MAERPGTTGLAEVKLGPITLLLAQAPALPSLNEQASGMAQFLIDVDTHLDDLSGTIEPRRLLRNGEIAAAYQQLTEDEVNAQKRQLVHFNAGVTPLP
jgi:hypothetical protein